MWPDHPLLDLGTGSLTHRGPWASFELRSLPVQCCLGRPCPCFPLRTFKAPREACSHPGLAHVISAPGRCHLSHFAKASSEVLSPSLCSLPTPNPPDSFGLGCKIFAKGRSQDRRRSWPRAGALGGSTEPGPSQLRSSFGPSPPTKGGKGCPCPSSLTCPAGRSGAPRGRQPEERLGARAGEGVRRCRLGPPSLTGAPTVSGSRRNQSG